jgi:ABC-type antimicrobial peptide transport system permease subunit
MITVLFMKRGLGICAAGAVIGLGGSVLALRVLSEIRGAPMTPGLIGLVSGVTAFVIGVAVVATWIPARRAAAIDPLSVLKAE